MWFLASCVAMAFALGLHGVICRVDVPLDRVVRFLAVGSAAGLALLVFMFRAYGISSVETWAAVFCYAFACELYIFLFTLVSSSISANLLMTLHGKTLTAQEVDALYDSERMVAQRVRRLLATGFLRAEGSDLKVTPKGLRLQRSLSALRGFFRHRD